MIRTFIVGSCVSRDTFEFLPRERFRLSAYVARQSIISAMSPPRPNAPPATDALSPFQRRSLEADWSSALLPSLQESLDEVDLILWDLCDERLGVYAFPDGSFLTRSVELIASGQEEILTTEAEFHAFGSDEHLVLWQESLSRFLAELRAAKATVVLIATEWAQAATDGTPTPASYGISAAEANRTYPGYYEALTRSAATSGLTLHRIPAQNTPSRRRLTTRFPFRTTVAPTAPPPLADAEHKWGLAPFHYESSVYEELSTQIQRLCAD